MNARNLEFDRSELYKSLEESVGTQCNYSLTVCQLALASVVDCAKSISKTAATGDVEWIGLLGLCRGPAVFPSLKVS